MFSGVDFVIIFEKEISEYYTQPFEDMYRDLVSIKKDHYTNEQIIITSFGWTNKNIWRHFFRIVNSIDIPTYFIKVKTVKDEFLKTNLPYKKKPRIIPNICEIKVARDV